MNLLPELTSLNIGKLDISDKLPLGQTQSLTENLEDRINCCADKPAEFRLNCMKGKIREILKTQEEKTREWQEMYLKKLAEIKVRDEVINALESHRKDSEQMIKRLDARINLHAEQIKKYAKKMDEKQATIDDQNKLIKQQKQRISKADKQSTKNHNLKMHTETLKSKVSKLQEENDTMKECPLCFEPYDNENRKPSVAKCAHVFCKDCLTKHTHSNSGCPMCRKRYAIRDVRELHLHFV